MQRYSAVVAWVTLSLSAALVTVWSTPATVVLGGLLAVVGFGVGVRFIRRSRAERTAPESPSISHPQVPSPESVVAAAASATALDAAEAVRFLERLTRPQSHFIRIDEEVQVDQRLLEAKIDCTIRLQGQPGSVAFVPVLRRVKGVGEERIWVEDRDEQPLIPLASAIVVGLVVRAVETVLSSLAPDAVAAFRLDARQELIALASAAAPKGADVAIAAIERLPGVLTGGPRRLLLADVCREVAEFNHVCVITDLVGQPTLIDPVAVDLVIVDATIRVRRTVVPRYRRAASATLVDRLRTLFGITPTRFFWSLDSAGRAQEYQLDLKGPGHSFLARQYIVDDTGDPVAPTGHVVAAVRRGQDVAHLEVVTGQPTVGTAFTADYYERTPTSLGPAAIAALALLAVITTGSLTVVDAHPLIGQGSYAGLLLGLPSAISVWFGIQALNRDHPGVLLARVFTIWTILLALIAAASSLGISPAAHVLDLPVWWKLLALLALLHAVFATASWLRRSGLYSHFIEGRSL